MVRQLDTKALYQLHNANSEYIKQGLNIQYEVCIADTKKLKQKIL